MRCPKPRRLQDRHHASDAGTGGRSDPGSAPERRNRRCPIGGRARIHVVSFIYASAARARAALSIRSVKRSARQIRHAEELRPPRALAVVIRPACHTVSVMLGEREVVRLLSEIVRAVIHLDRAQARRHERRDDLVLLRIPGVRQGGQPPSCVDQRNDVGRRGAPVWDVCRR